METINVGEVAVFDHVEPNKEQALKPLEEAAEVFGAWQKWNETKRPADTTRIFEEIADTVQACVNLAASVGAKDLTYAIENCKKRNIKRGRITEEKPKYLDADGEPIKFGDELYFTDGHITKLKCVGFSNDGFVEITHWESYEGWEPFVIRIEANELTHKKPDSWERLEKEAMLAPYDYCRKQGIDHKVGFASKLKDKDVIRRAKALAGVDDE